MGEAGLFERDAPIRRVFAEGILLLGGGRALLMQLAHPSVAAGVAEHSGFRADPFARLQRTLQAMTTIVYGSTEQAQRTADILRAVHDRVTGPGYYANDPALLLWVHATLVDTALRIHRRFLRPLVGAELQRFYEDSVRMAELLGVPTSMQPPDAAAFRSYVRATIASVEVSDDARRLARAILHPRVPTVTEPAALLGRQLTVGLLPAPLRAGYGESWDPARELAFQAACAATRQWLPLVPRQFRGAWLPGLRTAPA